MTCIALSTRMRTPHDVTTVHNCKLHGKGPMRSFGPKLLFHCHVFFVRKNLDDYLIILVEFFVGIGDIFCWSRVKTKTAIRLWLWGWFIASVIDTQALQCSSLVFELVFKVERRVDKTQRSEYISPFLAGCKARVVDIGFMVGNNSTTGHSHRRTRGASQSSATRHVSIHNLIRRQKHRGLSKQILLQMRRHKRQLMRIAQQQTTLGGITRIRPTTTTASFHVLPPSMAPCTWYRVIHTRHQRTSFPWPGFAIDRDDTILGYSLVTPLVHVANQHVSQRFLPFHILPFFLLQFLAFTRFLLRETLDAFIFHDVSAVFQLGALGVKLTQHLPGLLIHNTTLSTCRFRITTTQTHVRAQYIVIHVRARGANVR
mmetsp:Transcript_46839/g.69295  ORF Transcript_46839/g.69295 Transcript_46839/m.69295 type:complete len:371 (+) Transcript_46839:341-1453(+)